MVYWGFKTVVNYALIPIYSYATNFCAPGGGCLLAQGICSDFGLSHDDGLGIWAWYGTSITKVKSLSPVPFCSSRSPLQTILVYMHLLPIFK